MVTSLGWRMMLIGETNKLLAHKSEKSEVQHVQNFPGILSDLVIEGIRPSIQLPVKQALSGLATIKIKKDLASETNMTNLNKDDK